MSAPSVMAPSQKIAPISLDTFLRNSRPHTFPINAQNFADNSTVSYQIPQSGLGVRLWVYVSLTVVITGSSITGTFQQQAPYSALNRVQITNNGSTYAVDVSGWGLYKYLRYRAGIDPLAAFTTDLYNTDTELTLGVGGATLIRGGAAVSAGTYKLNLAFPIDFAYNNQCGKGLLNMQLNQTFWYLNLQWGSLASGISGTGGTNALFNTLGGTAITVSVTGTASAELEFFDYVFGAREGGLLNYFKSVVEMQNATPINGPNYVLIPPNNVVTMLLTEFRNNGLGVPAANMSNIQLVNSTNVYDYVDATQALHQAKLWWQHRGAVMDGVICHDLGLRGGLIDARDTYDSLSNASITSLQQQVTASGLTLINPTSTTIIETLQPFKQ